MSLVRSNLRLLGNESGKDVSADHVPFSLPSEWNSAVIALLLGLVMGSPAWLWKFVVLAAAVAPLVRSAFFEERSPTEFVLSSVFLLGSIALGFGVEAFALVLPAPLTAVSWALMSWEVHGVLLRHLVSAEKGQISADLHTRKQLAANVDNLRTQIAALVQGSSRKDVFVASLSQEMRGQMNGLMGMIGLLVQSNLSEEQREFAKAADKSAEYLLDVIKDLQFFSSVETAVNEAPFSIFDVVDAELKHCAILGRADVELISSFKPSVPEGVTGDATLLKDILRILLRAAVNSTHSQGAEVMIVVTATPSKAREKYVSVNFNISNTGLALGGVAEKPADGAVAQHKLTVATRLVELLGGTISLFTQETQGTTSSFTVDFRVDTSARQPEDALYIIQSTKLAQDNLALWSASLKQQAEKDAADEDDDNNSDSRTATATATATITINDSKSETGDELERGSKSLGEDPVGLVPPSAEDQRALATSPSQREDDAGSSASKMSTLNSRRSSTSKLFNSLVQPELISVLFLDECDDLRAVVGTLLISLHVRFVGTSSVAQALNILASSPPFTLVFVPRAHMESFDSHMHILSLGRDSHEQLEGLRPPTTWCVTHPPGSRVKLPSASSLISVSKPLSRAAILSTLAAAIRNKTPATTAPPPSPRMMPRSKLGNPSISPFLRSAKITSTASVLSLNSNSNVTTTAFVGSGSNLAQPATAPTSPSAPHSQDSSSTSPRQTAPPAGLSSHPSTSTSSTTFSSFSSSSLGAAVSPAPGAASATPPSSGDPATRSRALVADDDSVTQNYLKVMLRKLGFHCDVAGNGQVAVELHTKNPYSVIFMDCWMPVMDGFEAVRTIRAWEKDRAQRPVPILSLTSDTQSSVRQMCLDCGMTAFLSKPIRIGNLEEVILKLARDFQESKDQGPVGNGGSAAQPSHGNSIANSNSISNSTGDLSRRMSVLGARQSPDGPSSNFAAVTPPVSGAGGGGGDSAAAAASGAAGGASQAQILLVEDNLVNAKIASAVLTKNKHIVTVATNGKIALDKYMAACKGNPNFFTAVLMDIQMPVMDGLKSTKLIREWEAANFPQSPPTPIIALTADVGEEAHTSALEAGCTEYMPKPIDFSALLQLVDKFLAKRNRPT